MYCEASTNQQPVTLESMPQAKEYETYEVITKEIDRRIIDTTKAAHRILAVLFGGTPVEQERRKVGNMHDHMLMIRDNLRDLTNLVDDIEAYIKGRC